MEEKENHNTHNHSYAPYIIVWLALLTFTAITVAVAGINFGNATIAIALIIASIKTYLVLTIFMHLNIENKTFKIFVVIAIFFLAISFVLLFSDYYNF